jgi:hypothetical protein
VLRRQSREAACGSVLVRMDQSFERHRVDGLQVRRLVEGGRHEGRVTSSRVAVLRSTRRSVRLAAPGKRNLKLATDVIYFLASKPLWAPKAAPSTRRRRMTAAWRTRWRAQS